MNLHKRGWLSGLACVALATPIARAQAPAAPSPPSAAMAATMAQQLQPRNIWDMICKRPEQKAEKKERFCKSAFGKLTSNLLKPMTLYSGGILPECCPPDKPNPSDLAKPADSAQGAAAAIQAEEAAAKERRAAIRYLGTVDCHWYPEAEAALIGGLRADKNECVRYEAALALGNGCCCTKKTMEALNICADGSDKDKNPSENSERVKMAALMALNRCLACAKDKLEAEPPEAPQKLVPPEAPKTELAVMPAYYREVERKPLSQITADARRVIDTQAPTVAASLQVVPTGQRHLINVVNRAKEAPRGAETSPALPVAVINPEAAPLAKGVPVSRPGRRQ